MMLFPEDPDTLVFVMTVNFCVILILLRVLMDMIDDVTVQGAL